MKKTKIIMGMPVTVEIVDTGATEKDLDSTFSYFKSVDNRFSTYKNDSEISKVNKGEIKAPDYSPQLRNILKLSEATKKETDGYFDIVRPDGKIDPSGIVKGWAIHEAAHLLRKKGLRNFYIDAGGDIQVAGLKQGKNWQVGIRSPFNTSEIVKVLSLSNLGVATSGNYERGEHIYNPKTGLAAGEIASITVVGPNIYEADRFATAAFAMGGAGIQFIEKMVGFEGYMIDKKGIATYTTGFDKYIA